MEQSSLLVLHCQRNGVLLIVTVQISLYACNRHKKHYVNEALNSSVYCSSITLFSQHCLYSANCRYKKAPQVGLRAYNNIPQPNPYILGVREDCCMLSTLAVVLSCIYRFGTVSSLHPTSFLYLYIILVMHGLHNSPAKDEITS